MEKLQYLLKDIANNMDGHTFADSELRYVSTRLKPHKFYKHPSMIVTQRISQRDKAWRNICKGFEPMSQKYEGLIGNYIKFCYIQYLVLL